ncbi:MAG: murein biosynthesis integral membrane protein MurJ [Phycisphaerales bacterium]|nr:MAG: murein biosynthesis integral membrane protein MurJ [Phycisphaerales bacterium]
MKQDIGAGGLEEGSRLAKIVFSLSTIAIFTKIFGFAEKLVIAGFFGTKAKADVYFGATTIMLSIVWFVRELMYPSLLPVFADALSKPPSAPRSLFRKAFVSAAVFLGICSLVLGLLPGVVTTVLLPGFSNEKRLVTANLLRMLAPATLMLGLGMVTYTTLNARRKFLKAAFPEALLKLFVTVGLIALLPVLGIYSFGLVLGVGSLAYLIAHLYFIPESRFMLVRGDPDDGGPFKRVLLLMGPLVVGVVFSHISGLIDNLLASKLPGGHLSYLNYAKKLIDAILLIGPVALVTVVYSQLSHLASANERQKLRNLVIKTFRLLMYLTVPIACMLVVLRQPIIRCLFQRGQFDVDSTLGTSGAFMVYALGLSTLSLETLLVHSFFSLSDTKTPVKFGVLCVFLDIGLAIALLKPLGYYGIAGALVLSKTVKIVILSAILHKRLEGLFDRSIMAFGAKLIVIGCAVWSVLKLLVAVENSDSFLQTAVFDVILPGIGALAAFVLCSYALRIEEFKAMVSLVRYRKAAVKALYEETK